VRQGAIVEKFSASKKNPGCFAGEMILKRNYIGDKTTGRTKKPNIKISRSDG